MDDEFVPSSELEFISDDFNDAPETPGWKKPMSRHKTELFRQLFRMEQANRANDVINTCFIFLLYFYTIWYLI